MDEGTSIFCTICFAQDHRRPSCRLIAPEAPVAAAAAAPVADPAAGVDDEEEEEDPEEVIFEDEAEAVDGVALPAAAEEDFIPLPAGSAAEEDGASSDNFLPIVDAADYLPAPGLDQAGDSLSFLDSEDLEAPVRPDTVDVFMPFVDLRHFDHIAFALVNPTIPESDPFILQASDLACGPDRVSLFPSADNARVAVFASHDDRERAVANGPFVGREASIFFRRFDETDNRFVFEHEAMAALSVTRFPFEHWQRQHITHSSIPYANPHAIDPICLTGVDFQAVLITVKAGSLSDIPLNLAVKNYCGIGSFSEVSIIEFDDLEEGSDNSLGPDLDPIPEAFPSDGEEDGLVDLEGGAGYADMMEALGVPPPLVPHGAPHSAAPAASLVDRALANAPPLPTVKGDPVLSKPTCVHVKLRLGFFDVMVTGSCGERASFRLSLRKAASSSGSKGLLVANFTTASVGLLDSVVLVGPQRLPLLTVDILARSGAALGGSASSLAEAEDLVLGRRTPQAPAGALAAPVDGSPKLRRLQWPRLSPPVAWTPRLPPLRGA
jgi:hypothetical protein